MPGFVVTYTVVFSKALLAENLKAAEDMAKYEMRETKNHVLLAVRSLSEHQAALTRGEVG